MGTKTQDQNEEIESVTHSPHSVENLKKFFLPMNRAICSAEQLTTNPVISHVATHRRNIGNDFHF